MKNKIGLVGLIIVSCSVIVVIMAPLFSPYDPLELNFIDRFQGPTLKYFFGTDYYGRDIFSRVIFGTRISLYVASLSVFFSVIGGTMLGLISGYFGGIRDTLIMRFMDGILAFPPLLLAIAIGAVLGAGSESIIIALSVIYIPRYARVVRAATLALKEEEFVKAAVALGASSTRVIFFHILPNCFALIIIQVTTYFSQAIIAEAALSFLGLGAPQPAPSWGNILSMGKECLINASWVSIFPGIAITIEVLGFNFLGDGLRDILDPYMIKT